MRTQTVAVQFVYMCVTEIETKRNKGKKRNELRRFYQREFCSEWKRIVIFRFECCARVEIEINLVRSHSWCAREWRSRPKCFCCCAFLSTSSCTSFLIKECRVASSVARPHTFISSARLNRSLVRPTKQSIIINILRVSIPCSCVCVRAICA